MRIDEGLRQHWAEPHEAELFQPLRGDGEQAMAHEQSTTAPPPEPPAPTFWEPAPVPANALNDLPPAPQAQAAEETAAATLAQATAAPVNNTTGTAAATYAGEPPADPQWLLDREKALVAIRADYTAARTQAESTAGVGPGWVVASTVTDESGAPRSVSGRALVFVPDPTAPPVIAGYDESGLPIHQPNGRWMEFDEESFAAHYRTQGGTQLQDLAALYDTDVAGLFARHPEIWGIATSDHAINAGPPPAGRAMGDPGQLALLDLYMRDPQMAALIDAYGGQPAPATSEMAHELVRIHGQQRYEQLSRLDNAMASVRQQYADALVQAQTSGTGPGWVERARTLTISDESGRTSTQTLYVTDESGQPLRDASGQPQAQMERLFDPDVFTAWYVQQGGLQHQAFKDFYGQSHTTFATDESGRTVAAGTSFDNPNWSVSGIGWMAHKELVGIDPNDPPRLHDRAAVGFDLEAGWATHHSNIKPERDWFETAIQVAMVAVVSYISAGQLGPQAATAMGLTTTAANGTVALSTAGVMVSGAIAGGATSLVSGMMSGNLTFKGVLQGALAGGLSAGLLKELGPIAAQAGPVGTLALRTTVQGGIQALLGGEFKDGALAGFASGLADLAGASMKANIDNAVVEKTMTAAEAATAHKLARIVGSAIRAAGNPDDPGHAFASAFLDDLLQQAGPLPATSATAAAAVADAQVAPSDPLPLSERDQEWIEQSDAILFNRGDELAAANAAHGQESTTPGDGPLSGGDDEAAGGNAGPIKLPDGRLQYPDGRILTPSVEVITHPAQADTSTSSVNTTVSSSSVDHTGDGQPSRTSAYGSPYVPVFGYVTAPPVGGYENLTPAPDLPPLATELAPNFINGPAGSGIPYRDQAGQVWYRTFDSTGAEKGWVTVAEESSAQSLADLASAAAPLVLTGLRAEAAYGPWPLRVAAVATLAGVTWLTARGTDDLLDREALDPERVRDDQLPPVNVPVPPGPAGTPGYVADERDTSTPGYQSPDSQSSSTTTLPVTDPSWHDTIVTKDGNADNNASLADQRARNNSALHDPKALAGQSVPDIGTWAYPGTPRGHSGADYQEQRTGVPAGLELNVGGTITTTANGGVPRAEGGANFEGIRTEGGRVVLIDTKDWPNYVMPDRQFWVNSVLGEADKQVRAVNQLDANVSIEWQVSTQAAADAITRTLARRPDIGSKINVVHVPKEMP